MKFLKPTAALPLALTLLSLGACSDDSTGARAEFGRPRALAFSGRGMFAAATTNPRLRVLNLDTHKVVRAPNPIFSLSIPTISLPQAIASYRSPDGSFSSPFVVSMTTDDPRLAIISAPRRLLIGYMPLPGIPLAMDMAALPEDGADSVVHIALRIGSETVLTSLTLPSELAAGAIDVTKLELVREADIDISGMIPKSMLASPTDPNLLAIAGLSGDGNGILLINTAEKTVTGIATSVPVSSMSFDPTGKRLFAVIDSLTCTAAGTKAQAVTQPRTKASSTVTPGSEGQHAGDGLEGCTGLLAVDVETGTLLRDKPLKIPGILRGVAAGGSAELELPDGSKRTVEPLLLAASTEGALYPVDGDSLSLIKATKDAFKYVLKHVDQKGRESFSETAPEDIAINPMRAMSETVSILYEGKLPQLKDRNGILTAGGLMSAGTDFAALGAVAGDRVEISSAKKGCESFTVTSVSVGQLGLEDVPQSCEGQVTYVVRAAGTYLVTGSKSGLMGRVEEGQNFVFEGAEPFDYGEEVSSDPALAFTMNGIDHDTGCGWTIKITTDIAPYGIPLSALIMPESIVCDWTSGDFYVAYQGGNAILRVVPRKLEHGSVSTSDGLTMFR